MKKRTNHIYNKIESFFGIRSIGKAFVVRGFELILLTTILLVSNSYFPEWNFLAVIVVGGLVVTVVTYFIFRRFLNMETKNDSQNSSKRISEKSTKKPISDEEKEIQAKEKSRERFKDFTLYLGVFGIITIITQALLSIKNFKELFESISSVWTLERFQLGVNILNIIVSFLAMVFFLKLFKSSNSFFPVTDLDKYEKLTDIEDPKLLMKKSENNPVRVQNLVRQYVLFISLFAFSLVAVYVSIIIHSSYISPDNAKLDKRAVELLVECQKTEQKDNCVKPSREELKFNNLVSEHIPNTVEKNQIEELNAKINELSVTVKDKNAEELSIIRDLKTKASNLNAVEKSQIDILKTKIKVKENKPISWFDFITNIINFSGALFIFLAFKVLHDETLQKKDYSTYTFFWMFPSGFFVFYVLVLGLLYLVYFDLVRFDPETNPTIFLNWTDLFAGSINGLAMALLFGRYVSIEQSVKSSVLSKLKHTNLFLTIPYKKIVSKIIIFILPIYALTQPLFGSLTIDSFGNPKLFQTMVFVICLIGKILFFIITYLLIRKKLLHLYLHGVVAEVRNLQELEKCLDFNYEEKDSLKE